MINFKNLASLIAHNNFIRNQITLDIPFFFVGGTIRDLLLGIIQEPNDLDLTCAIHPDELKKHIKKEGISLFDTEKYGTITIIPKNLESRNKILEETSGEILYESNDLKSNVGNLKSHIQYEITPFRTETGYKDLRHPDDITRSDSLIDDSKRRDFTINAMYATILEGYTCKEDIKTFERNEKTEKRLNEQKHLTLPNNVLLIQDLEIINTITSNNLASGILNFLPIEKSANSLIQDPLIIILDTQNGFNDLCNKQLKAVGDPLARMNEDALRILRGARFINTLNQSITTEKVTQNPPCYFDIENKTWKAMQKSFYLVRSLPKERLHQELMKVFTKNKAFEYIANLDELGLIPQLFPALERCKNVLQPTRYHPLDVYVHTLMVLRAVQERNTNSLVKFAALYHDVGKVDQYRYHSLGIPKEEKGSKLTGHMYHTNIGPELVKTDFGNLGFSKKEIEEIVWYVAKHHRPGEILDADPKNRSKKLRELLSEGGYERCQNLLDLAIADRIGQMNPIQPTAIDELLSMKDVLTALYQSEGQFTAKDLAINGNILMEMCKLQPGKQLGELLQKSFAFARDNPSERNNEKELISYCKQLLKQSGKKK